MLRISAPTKVTLRVEMKARLGQAEIGITLGPVCDHKDTRLSHCISVGNSMHGV